MLSPSGRERGPPAASGGPGRGGWKAIDLRRALPSVVDPRQRGIVANAIALSRLRIEDDFRCDCDGEFVGFGAVLSLDGERPHDAGL